MISSQYKIISIEICQITNLRLGKFPKKVLCKRFASHQPSIVFWQVGEMPIGPAESDPLEEEGQLFAELVQLQHQVGEESAGGAEGGKGLSASFSFLTALLSAKVATKSASLFFCTIWWPRRKQATQKTITRMEFLPQETLKFSKGSWIKAAECIWGSGMMLILLQLTVHHIEPTNLGTSMTLQLIFATL